MMKKIYLLTGIWLSSFCLKAQTNTFPQSGNVGIGTNTPESILQIKGNSGFDSPTRLLITNNATAYGRTHLVLTGRFEGGNDAWLFGSGARNSIIFSQNMGGNVGDYGDEKFSFQLEGNSNSLGFLTKQKGNNPAFVLTQSGNVGIGITEPLDKFSVDGVMAAHASEGRQVTTYLPNSYTVGDIVSGSSYKWYDDKWTIGNVRSGSYPTGGFGIALNNDMALKIMPNGDIGIGTTSPQEKLSVNGKIRAKEIKVEVANWPDYVFNEDYKLSSLKDLDYFIKTNSHLPEVPSAVEVEKNGYELGKMDKILLKKVEELTLHLIEKDKQVRDQANAIKLLSEQMIFLQKQINRIKNEKK